MSILTERDLSTLLSGECIVAAHGRYDAARAVWNGCIDRRPHAIVRCRSVRDVAEAVRATVRLGVPQLKPCRSEPLPCRSGRCTMRCCRPGPA